MRYSIKAAPRQGFSGFRRDGRFFSAIDETILTEEEMTPAILAEARNEDNPVGMLIVKALPDMKDTAVEFVPDENPVVEEEKAIQEMVEIEQPKVEEPIEEIAEMIVSDKDSVPETDESEEKTPRRRRR